MIVEANTRPTIPPELSFFNANLSSSVDQNSKTQGQNGAALLPIGLARFFDPLAYTQGGKADLIPSVSKESYILSAIPTPQVAGQLAKAKIANIFQPAWMEQVSNAVTKNAGFGNDQEGFLAWSEIGFVRLLNPNLSAEQNKRLAAFSLETGIPIEKTPARAESSVEQNPKISEWIEEFLANAETKLQEFLANPSEGVEIKDGRNRYFIQFDQTSGEVISGHYRKHGGFSGFIERNFKTISKITGLVSAVGKFFPGWGRVASFVADGVQTISTMVNKGSVKFKDILSSAISIGRDYFDTFGGSLKDTLTSVTDKVVDWGKGVLTKGLEVAKKVLPESVILRAEELLGRVDSSKIVNDLLKT
jgi:hypothetical protein